MSIPRWIRRRYQSWCQSDSFPWLLNCWPPKPPPPSDPLCLESQFAWRISIPRWICRYVPNVVTIGPAVWQLPHTFECLTPKPPPKCPHCVSRAICLAYIHSQVDQHISDSFDVNRSSRLTASPDFWICDTLTPPQMPPGILRGDLYISYVHFYMNPQTWIKIGANRTASPECWFVDPLKNPKCVSRDNLIGAGPISIWICTCVPTLVPIGPAVW